MYFSIIFYNFRVKYTKSCVDFSARLLEKQIVSIFGLSLEKMKTKGYRRAIEGLSKGYRTSTQDRHFGNMTKKTADRYHFKTKSDLEIPGRITVYK